MRITYPLAALCTATLLFASCANRPSIPDTKKGIMDAFAAAHGEK